MADFESSPEEEEAAYRGLRSLIDETLRDLKVRVDFLHEHWHGKSDEEKAQFGWCVALGVLAHDVGSAIVTLVDVDRLRAAKILNRSLFEYHLRLRIYQADASEALRDATDAPKELRRFFESTPVSDVAKLDISAEDLAEFEAFLKEHEGKPRSRRVLEDLETVNAGNRARTVFEYRNLYAFASALAHGTGLVFKEVVQGAGAAETVLRWRSPHLTRFLTIGEAFGRVVGILQAVEETSGYFQAHVVINRKYAAIMRPIAQRFKQTMKEGPIEA